MRSTWSVQKTAVALLLTVPFVYPFVFAVFTAVKKKTEYLVDPVGLPHSFTWASFSEAWNGASLGRGMLNSLIAVGIGVVLCCLLSMSAAFWFHRHPGRLARLVFIGICSVWALPFVIWLIPSFVLLSDLNLTNSLVTLGVMYAALNVPFGVYLMWSYYKSGIPPEVMEAAEVDGASLLRQFTAIVMPLSLPGLATVASLSFVFMWGDLFIAVVLLQDPSKFTLVPAASTLVTRLNPAIQDVAAATVISLIPQLVVFLFAQRAMIRGFTAGVGK
jgi:ABC-type glycerol-3-phosphate transport system permease component